MDLFKDYFTRQNLAKVLLKTQYLPGRLGELGLFTTRGLTTTTALIEELPVNAVSITQSIPRGAPANVIRLENRKMHDFQTESYAWNGSVLADEVLNVRAAGSGAAEIITTRIADLTAKLRRSADLQFEYLKMQCLKAPSNSMGTAPAAVAINVASDSAKLREELFNKIILPLETALGGIPYTRVRVLCSDGYWVKLIENKWIKDTYLNTAAASVIRQAGFVDEISIANVTFERYRGAGVVGIAADSAIAFPEGVDELFLQCFAPDDTLSSVGAGAMGAPYYLRAAPLEDDKGYRITLQTHPLMLCTRPQAILAITL